MIKDFSVLRRSWYIQYLLMAVISGWSLLDLSVYDHLIDQQVLPGTVSQDLLSMIVAILSLVLLWSEISVKKLQVLVGLDIYSVYAYGIYVIERVYNQFYLIYLYIFGSAIYTTIFVLVNLQEETYELHMCSQARVTIAGFLLVVPIIFTPMWLSQLLPLMINHEKIEFLYSIFLLDLSIFLPGLVITGIGLLRKKPLATSLASPQLVFGATLLLPVALGELVKPFISQNMAITDFFFYLILSVVFTGFAVFSFMVTKTEYRS